MNTPQVFERREIKYFITPSQKKIIIKNMQDLEPDKYGRTTIRNIYFDTDNYHLARKSIERPVYKEKLRIRSYNKVKDIEPVFVEIKKKYKSIVYKRREIIPWQQAVDWYETGGAFPKESQIGRELTFFWQNYENLAPKVFLSYEREAYQSTGGSDLRVTFDENIMARKDKLSLSLEAGGIYILNPNITVMEVKTSQGMPLWMSKLLNGMKVYKTSFSKYGTAYENIIRSTLSKVV